MSQMPSRTEENYLKAIYKLTVDNDRGATTNQIAESLFTRAASVTDMIKRLSEKNWVEYIKYQGVKLTTSGKQIALNTVRKHRLWEVFLVQKLGFTWDEIHDIAEELEHIEHEELINRLDVFLGKPEFDPHGDPIPNKEGKISQAEFTLMFKMKPFDKGIVSGVEDHRPAFLQYLDLLNLTIGASFKVLEVIEYDQTMKIEFDNGVVGMISREVTRNVLVKKVNHD